jgi:hypothetical protein
VLSAVRTFAVGVIDPRDLDTVAGAVGRALDVELNERYGLNVGGGRYFSNWSLSFPDPEIHVVTNYSPDEEEWKYEEDKDVSYVVDIWAKDAAVDIGDVLSSLRVSWQAAGSSTADVIPLGWASAPECPLAVGLQLRRDRAALTARGYGSRCGCWRSAVLRCTSTR